MSSLRQILRERIRHISRAMLATFLTALHVAIALAQGPSNAETAIRALEKQWTYAQAHNDNRALDLIFDSDLVYVEYGRLVSKGEYLARIRRQVPSSDEVVMDPIAVHTFENTAIVIGGYREKKFQSNQHHIMRWRFIDTWVYKKNGWVLVAAAATPLK